ncbi:hypothetical protein B0H13DRAFT_2347856 [Mycena leptocephala]|nr:hypothetical protein B0H13DRAFT_2347856 [Mycena leptocephala]
MSLARSGAHRPPPPPTAPQYRGVAALSVDIRQKDSHSHNSITLVPPKTLAPLVHPSVPGTHVVLAGPNAPRPTLAQSRRLAAFDTAARRRARRQRTAPTTHRIIDVAPRAHPTHATPAATSAAPSVSPHGTRSVAPVPRSVTTLNVHERLDSPSPPPPTAHRSWITCLSDASLEADRYPGEARSSTTRADRRPAEAVPKRRGRERNNKTAGNQSITPRTVRAPTPPSPASSPPRAARTPPHTHTHPAREMEWRVRPS